VITRQDEERILGEYQDLLANEEERARTLQRELDRLRAIVKGIEGRLQAQQETGKPTASAAAPESSQPVSVRHGRPTFAASVRQIMGDGVERDAATLLAELHARNVLRADGHRTMQMQKVSNVLVELTKQGHLVRPVRGIYKLASSEASENGAGREGPHFPVHPGVQKPPDEEVISPRPGHPDDHGERPGVESGPDLGSGDR
jgi:hypothetical protein